MRVILVGGGQMIYFLARQFASKGYHLTVINRQPDEAKMLSQRIPGTVILGDGSDPAVLAEAGARQADVVLSLTPHDPDNLVVCQIAQQMFGVPRTVALINDPDHEEVFRELGVTVAFSTTKIIATLIEESTAFDDIIASLPIAGGKINVTEVALPAEAPAVGQSLRELDLPADSLVATIIRAGQVIVPSGSSRLQAADRLILITLPENYGEVLRALTGDEG